MAKNRIISPWIEELSNEELVDEINKLGFWDGDLVTELMDRAFPDYDAPWEVGDEITYEAARKLGYELDEGGFEYVEVIRKEA